MNVPLLKNIGKIMLLSMFLLSGAKKILKLGNTETKQFTDVFMMPLKLARVLVFSAGILEVVSLLLVFSGELMRNKPEAKKLRVAGITTLIVFTILVTLLFKFYPKFKPVAALSNLAVLGGLLLALAENFE